MTDWTEYRITVKTKDMQTAADIATMAAKQGIYVEDYSDLKKQAWDIAHIDLIDEELLEKDPNKAVIHVYVSPEDDDAEILAYISERLKISGIDFSIESSLSKTEDWENNWKQYFHSTPVGDRILIHPVWETEYDPDGRIVLDIEPGLAFGSGSHETTRLCLEALEKHITPETAVLDIGCGSGILSVASLLLGAKEAVGVDIDALAVKTARENGAKNGFVSPRYTVIEGDLAEKVSGKYDVVVANIVADIIIKLCKSIKDYLKDNGIFIVSGIIDTREDDVLSAFRESGLSISKRHCDKGWICYELSLI